MSGYLRRLAERATGVSVGADPPWKPEWTQQEDFLVEEVPVAASPKRAVEPPPAEPPHADRFPKSAPPQPMVQERLPGPLKPRAAAKEAAPLPEQPKLRVQEVEDKRDEAPHTISPRLEVHSEVVKTLVTHRQETLRERIQELHSTLEPPAPLSPPMAPPVPRVASTREERRLEPARLDPPRPVEAAPSPSPAPGRGEPRLLIGRLEVQVVSTAPAPAERQVVRVVERRSSRQRVARTSLDSKLGFGLEQM